MKGNAMAAATALDRLGELRVRDVMAQPVVTVEACHTMCEAAERLVEAGLTAAPVVDEAGRCVGMITSVDFLKRDAQACAVDRLARRERETRIERHAGAALQISETDHDRVSRYMTAAVQAVSGEAALVDAARQMCLLHVHHLPVLDAQGRPVGMLSSLDLAAALVGAVDERRVETARGG